jgi:Predicted esterase
MNIIYLHGFKSSSSSIKGQLLEQYCAKYPDIQVHLPDLNMPPIAAIQKISKLIQSMDQVHWSAVAWGDFMRHIWSLKRMCRLY